MSEEIKELKITVEEQAKEISDLKSEVSDLEYDVKQHKDTIHELEEKLDKLRDVDTGSLLGNMKYRLNN